MKWFFVYMATIAPPPCPGIDCGINPAYRNTFQEQRLEMPSLEVCRQVRSLHGGSKCITEDVDNGDAAKGDTWQQRSTPPNTLTCVTGC